MKRENLKDNGCTCDRCGDTYKIDLNLPDEFWNTIIPTNYKMLCPECIGLFLKRMDEFGAYRLHSLTAPEREVKEEEMELAGLKLQNKLGDRIVTFNYTFVAGAKWMQDKLKEI